MPQTETLPTLYQYPGSLTGLVTSQGGNQGEGKWLCRLTETLPTLYQYIGTLTRRWRYNPKTGEGEDRL